MLELLPRDGDGTLATHERVIERGLASFVEVGEALAAIRDGRLYRGAGYGTFDDYIAERWPDLGGRNYANRVIAASETAKQLVPVGTIALTERQVRPLTQVPAEHLPAVWERVRESVGTRRLTAALVERAVAEFEAERAAVAAPPTPPERPTQPPERAAEPAPKPAPRSAPSAPAPHPGAFSLREWDELHPDMQRTLLDGAGLGSRATFNRTNDMVEWALWTWNPVTGCDHGCDYCYARDITQHYPANYPHGFAPTFWPDRLAAGGNMRVPPAAARNIGEKNVFVCSMADLFGKWVPQAWIDAVFERVEATPEWNFLFLTKFPQRLAELEWPANAWVGTTVDTQARVANAERSFAGVHAGVKWLSCEPLLERLTFSSLEMFDWVVIGSSQRSSQTVEFQPPWEWVEHLITQARDAGCQVYLKHQLTARPREYPSSGI